ncbi:MAG TPA: family 20 glycosylhydrolase [Chitinophagaceae bacterium]|nr:family 20 glycosylhydrolase [Chitinophagaceae bacterium]
MKFLTALLCAALIAGSCPASVAPPVEPNLGIVPAPAMVERLGGYFLLNKATIIEASGFDAMHCATLLNDYLGKAFGITLLVKNESAIPLRAHVIRFDLRANTTPPEGYLLQSSHNGITIISNDGAGLFYGLQSLMQMTDAAFKPPVQGVPLQVEVPCANIQDAPRFPYRGMHLDCGRHFFSVAFIKTYLDLMSRYKLNTFHWHLTEDQGWRIEIKRYPLLTTVGSIRSQTVTGHEGSANQFDGQSYGGFYTQDEIRDIVDYARLRYITVIPEIEMPGHSLAALAAYPYLGCTGGPYAVGTHWGVFPDVFCPSGDSTFVFLENVLTEVMQLFPSHYIHIGGDECPKIRWEHDPRDIALMKSLGDTSADQLQSYFIERIEKFLNAHGRDIIGWDEILEGGLAQNATVMSWRGEAGGIAAAELHHKVIMTPGNWLYFDKGQGNPATEPLNIGGYLPLSKVYSYDPVPAVLPDSEKKYILGAQANLWSEYIPSPEKAEYMILPRMLALAEIDWTPLDKKNYGDFLQRLPGQLAWMDRQGYHFRIPEPQGLSDSVTTQDRILVKLTPPLAGTRIFYSLDSAATVTSPLYSGPITLSLQVNKPDTLNVVEVSPAGNTSVDYRAVYLRQENQKAKPGAHPATALYLKSSPGKSRGISLVERSNSSPKSLVPRP